MTQHGGSSGDWSMTSTSDGGSASAGGDGTANLVPNHLAALVPSFDPAKDDLVAYTQKVQLLVGMWPDQKWTELATRLILNCSGSAFMKLQLQHTELTKNEKKSIQRLIEVLGGHWGQINLEKQYEYAERALYPKAGKFVNLHFPWIYIFARIYIPNLRKLKGKCKFYIFPKNVVFR